MGLIQAYPMQVELSFLAIDYLNVSQLSASVCSQPPSPWASPPFFHSSHLPHSLLPLQTSSFSSFLHILLVSIQRKCIFLREVFPDIPSKVRLQVTCSRNGLCVSLQCSLCSYDIIDTHLSCWVISMRTAATGWSWSLGHPQSLEESRCLMNAG